jgi:hypothetical protein
MAPSEKRIRRITDAELAAEIDRVERTLARDGGSTRRDYLRDLRAERDRRNPPRPATPLEVRVRWFRNSPR